MRTEALSQSVLHPVTRRVYNVLNVMHRSESGHGVFQTFLATSIQLTDQS